MTKPFIKWAGGKKVILKTLVENLPDRSISNYYEPFLGGGSLFFHLRESYLQKAGCYLNDVNSSLINVYSQIKDNVDELLSNIEGFKYDREMFYEVRKLFSENKSYLCPKQAARFIYLNKCCFNGLYRENKSGQFNAPFGKYKSVLIKDETTLRRASEALQGNVTLTSKSFNEVFEGVTENNPDSTLVYFDPPYYPEKENSFVNYTGFCFGPTEHVLLRNCVDFLNSFGASVLLSNSDTPFIRELYKDYNLLEVTSRRSINRDGSNRKPKKELLIKNFS